ncbi:DegT/DnrJ/EryC1/StrS family aminotransferase [Lacisediminihabitans sp.]|jgi:dTDP-4-amino-4,6-dideoxygalactose transaminase|uniref:DegT/DnrJ/EryC1/StrS family aminotransferase n=1 Tax=Lacisediminihabitans sp. TaxID=2787631 RepID=UPI002F95BA8D
MTEIVPFFDLGQAIRPERAALHRALDEVIDSGYFIGGALTNRFESEFADFVGAEHCIGTGNGLDAIRLILEAYDIGVGDEVIVPAFTFYATWLGVTQTGATPVPVEVFGHSANIDPGDIERAITPRTKAIIAVHLYGQAADLRAVRAVADAHGLVVVEDAAQSHGAMSTAGMTGSAGDAAAFSFYPTKNLGALGDAGAVTTSDPEIARRVTSRRSYGQGSSKYDHVDTGWNSRLDPLQATFLSLHLANLDTWTARRRSIASTYLEALGPGRSAGVVGPVDVSGSVWHHFVLRAQARAELQAFLSERGVTTDAHYPYSVHELAPMRALMSEDSLAQSFPVAEALSRQVTSLPMGPWMNDAQVAQVAAALHEVPDTLLVG